MERDMVRDLNREKTLGGDRCARSFVRHSNIRDKKEATMTTYTMRFSAADRWLQALLTDARADGYHQNGGAASDGH